MVQRISRYWLICLLVIAWNADAATRPEAVGRRAMVTSAARQGKYSPAMEK